MTATSNPTIELMDACHNHIGNADFALFASSGNAEPTSRVLEGSNDHGYAEEWVERGTYNGEPCRLVYLFDDADICDADGNPLEEADSYPWDVEHMARIIMD
ncbi:MAG: hypothetical protein KKF77_01755 [Proteobacteria bacterium]|nr:hypothetical protein [Pseudomonadota bacterium]